MTWSSSNMSVATVGASGLVAVVGERTAQVTARAGLATASRVQRALVLAERWPTVIRFTLEDGVRDPQRSGRPAEGSDRPVRSRKIPRYPAGTRRDQDVKTTSGIDSQLSPAAIHKAMLAYPIARKCLAFPHPGRPVPDGTLRRGREYPCQADAVFSGRDLPSGVSRDGSVTVSASHP